MSGACDKKSFEKIKFQSKCDKKSLRAENNKNFAKIISGILIKATKKCEIKFAALFRRLYVSC